MKRTEEGSQKKNDKKKIQNRRKTSKYINNHINLNRLNSYIKKKKRMIGMNKRIKDPGLLKIP